MTDFLQNYGAMLGAGAGLLPSLLKNLFGSSSQNFQGTGQPADVVAAVSPNPTQAVQAYNAAGGNPGGGMATVPQSTTPNGSNNMMGGLQSLMGALNPQKTAAPNGGQLMGQPMQVQQPNYAGTGANLSALPALNNGLSATGPGGLPLGTAASNPLAALFARRLMGQ